MEYDSSKDRRPFLRDDDLAFVPDDWWFRQNEGRKIRIRYPQPSEIYQEERLSGAEYDWDFTYVAVVRLKENPFEAGAFARRFFCCGVDLVQQGYTEAEALAMLQSIDIVAAQAETHETMMRALEEVERKDAAWFKANPHRTTMFRFTEPCELYEIERVAGRKVTLSFPFFTCVREIAPGVRQRHHCSCAQDLTSLPEDKAREMAAHLDRGGSRLQ